MALSATNMRIEDLRLNDGQPSELAWHLFNTLNERIPMQKQHHANPVAELPTGVPSGGFAAEYLSTFERRVQCQLGTLGGGNHFIEFQMDDRGDVWVMVHSGSRNFGLQVAKFYDEVAQELNKTWYSNVAAGLKLAFLPLSSEEGRQYLADMHYCCDFAAANRAAMLHTVAEVLYNEDFTMDEERLNVRHNYAAIEHHYGRDVVVHRKGAIRARVGDFCIVPGCQGRPSYLATGKGEPKSFTSFSHGAGRVLGRKKAKEELDLDTELAKLQETTVLISSLRSKDDLDEAMGAYKDIEEVMALQSDLADINKTLLPLIVLKGTGGENDTTASSPPPASPTRLRWSSETSSPESAPWLSLRKS